MTADRSRAAAALATNGAFALGLGAMGYWLCYERPVAYVRVVSGGGWAQLGALAAYLIATAGFLWLAAWARGSRRLGALGGAAVTLFVASRAVGAVDATGSDRARSLLPLGILFLAVVMPQLPRASRRLGKLYERLGVPVVSGRVLPLFLLAALIPYAEVVRALPGAGMLANLWLGTALAVMAVDLLVRSRGGARAGTAVFALPAFTVVLATSVAAATLALPSGSSLRRDLNDYAAHRFPAEGMFRQAEKVFRHIQSHPEVQQDDTVLNRAIVYRRSGRDAEAEQVLRNELAVQRERQLASPDDPEPFRRSGRILLLLDEVWAAQTALETAITIDSRRLAQSTGRPDEWRIRWSLAKSQHAIGRREAAIEEIARAKELAPDDTTREEITHWLFWEDSRAWLVEVDEAERERIVMTLAVEV